MEKKVYDIDTEKNNLIALYENWAKELPDELTGSEYSNPYYVSIPDDWFDSGKTRIMVVGEEGAGKWGCGKTIWKGFNETEWCFKRKEDIFNIQEYNRVQTAYQLGIIKEAKGYTKNNGRFWKRINNIKGIKNNIVIIWNNLDKIHKIKNGCVLSSDERQKLHDTHIKILAEEIRILSPTIVVFCGWSNRKDAFRLEFTENDGVYEKFFKKNNGKYECEQYKNEDKLYDIYYMKKDSITYILTKHPQWQTNEYENKVIEVISKSN